MSDWHGNRTRTRRLRTGSFLLLGALTFAAAGLVQCTEAADSVKTTSEKSPLQPLDIRVDDESWGQGQRDIQRVCQSAAMELWRSFPGRRLPPIIVSRSHDGPIVLTRRLENGEYQVRLDSQGTYWCQFAYQFAHEFCHIMCNYDEDEHANKWFEESLCEMASLYVLRRMSESWKTSPPYPNWKDYAPHLKSYADNRIKDSRLPPDITLAQWYGENAAQLYAGATQREKNQIVATALLPLVEEEPGRWEAVAYLNATKGFKNQSFKEYLQGWEYFVPRQHKPFVRRIATMLDADRHGSIRPADCLPTTPDAPAAAEQLRLAVKPGDWGGAQVADIEAVLRSARDEFCSNFSDPPSGTINVVRSFNGPSVFYRDSPNDPHTFHVDVSGNHWAQFAFQFTPLLCHAVMNSEGLRGDGGKAHPYGWLHNSLCQLAAVTTIRQMSVSWKTDAPYPNWRSFASSLAAYAEGLTEDPQHRLPEGMTLNAWYRKNKTALRDNSTMWDKNSVVAMSLLPLFDRNPGGWGAICHMPSDKSATLADYLARWRESAPERHKAFIKEIASALEN